MVENYCRSWFDVWVFYFSSEGIPIKVSTDTNRIIISQLEHFISLLSATTTPDGFDINSTHVNQMLVSLQKSLDILPKIITKSLISYEKVLEYIDIYFLCLHCFDLITLELKDDPFVEINYQRKIYVDCLKHWGLYKEVEVVVPMELNNTINGQNLFKMKEEEQNGIGEVRNGEENEKRNKEDEKTETKRGVEESLSIEGQWVSMPKKEIVPEKDKEFLGFTNAENENMISVGFHDIEILGGTFLNGMSNHYVEHSLIPRDENKLLSVAGHTKDPSETLQVKVFDLQSCTWSTSETYGKPPISRGGQSVTRVGTTLVIFGGQDSKRSLMNDLHILDLQSLTWNEMDTIGVPPSAQSNHTAAVHADRYLLIFSGGSHATCFNDLHVLDLHSRKWSRPTQHSEDVIVCFGGYSGRYNNEVNVLKPNHKSIIQSKTLKPPGESVSAVQNVIDIWDMELVTSCFRVWDPGGI